MVICSFREKIYSRTIRGNETVGLPLALYMHPVPQFVSDGLFRSELNSFLKQELAEDGYSGVEVRVTPTRTEIIILATRTQNVLGEKGRRIRELTAVVQKRFNFPEGTVEVGSLHLHKCTLVTHLVPILEIATKALFEIVSLGSCMQRRWQLVDCVLLPSVSPFDTSSLEDLQLEGMPPNTLIPLAVHDFVVGLSRGMLSSQALK